MKRRSLPGFTLVEVLIALGVFAVGMIAVASLFPVAAILQRETVAEVLGEHAAQSAKAIVEAKGLTYAPPSSSARGDLDRYHDLAMAGKTKTNVVPLHAINNRLLTERLPFGDRSYPTAQVIGANISNCDLHWVPFVQDIAGNADTPNWVMRVFLLEADSRANYPFGPGATLLNAANPNDPNVFPKVVPIGCSAKDQDTFQLADANHGLEGGDKIMDNNGTDYTISEVNGAEIKILGRILYSPSQPKVIWYAPPYGGSGSPAKRIVTVKLNVLSLP